MRFPSYRCPPSLHFPHNDIGLYEVKITISPFTERADMQVKTFGNVRMRIAFTAIVEFDVAIKD